ncbi:tetratricopeptide repeat-containing sensor histidine kinase [Sphingomonas kyeonggiensis]|uniref:histidine kinase n=1 Tax=Sphingomonas kyeonggiensis TaxID=1268553 RepID=A0A7W6NV93_9SPHN|nr:ATP-binding protein [Sphingomonas kyeonggiensis]MBB4096908.1 signal transduction histidine kinase/CheY-like chemotaxis protein [Sphingomonas kyeonggiensis]
MRGILRSLTCLALLLAAPALAQQPPQKSAFPAAIEAEIQAAKDSMMTDQAVALRHAAMIDTLAKPLADPRQRILAMATARWLAAEANLRNDQPGRAAPLLQDGLNLIASVPEPIKLRADLLMSQGALFMARDQAVKALDSYQNAYRVFGEAKELRGQAVALQNIASLYFSANDNARAEQYYRQAADLYDSDPALSLSLHNNRGNVLFAMDRNVEAGREYEAAINIARTMGKPVLEARILSNYARSQVALKRFDVANQLTTRGFELLKGADADTLHRHLLATAAVLASERGDNGHAVRLIREAFAGLDLTKTTVEFRSDHLYAYQIFDRAGASIDALDHLRAAKRISDEAAKVATTTSAALMAAKFNWAKQRNDILELQNREVENRARTQLTMFLLIGAATVIVMGALGWGLVTIRRSRNKVRAANIVLGETNVALEKALKAKTEFLATTSHEIRTPLNGILGMTQVMLSDPKLEERTRERIGIVHGAGVTMRALVDDILDVAKMETGNLSVEAAPMDLCATLREVTKLWEEQARAKGLSFKLELSHAPHWIVSDATRMRQVVFNLLSNAIKFTEKGGVTLRAVAEGEGDARRLKLAIEDTGIGIPPEKFEEIFESFRQVDTSTTRRFGGTGLGLAICRNLARALGGDIMVESEDGKGSRFIVDLPLVPAEAPAAAAASESAGGLDLVVLDRNPIARSMLRTLLEPRVARLRFAGSVAEALPMLAEAGVGHLLADEGTLKAEADGPIQALAALRAGAESVPHTILWLKPDAETSAELIAASGCRIIEKPVTGAALIDAIIPPAEENSDKRKGDPLVSRAA